MQYLLLFAVLFPFIWLNVDMFGNNFDAHFSDETKKKLRVKDDSFLRKVIPYKEKDYITKEGITYGHRYFLTIRAVPLFVYSLFFIILLPTAIINCIIVFIPISIMIIISGILLLYIILHEVIISICSQGLHL